MLKFYASTEYRLELFNFNYHPGDREMKRFSQMMTTIMSNGRGFRVAHSSGKHGKRET